MLFAETPKPVWPKAGCPNADLPNAVVVVPPNADGVVLVPKAGGADVVNAGTEELAVDAEAWP